MKTLSVHLSTRSRIQIPNVFRLGVVLVLAVCCCFAAPPGRAASSSATSYITSVDTTSGPVTLSGVVLDQAGHPVPAAVVSMKFLGTTRSATTGVDGRYTLPDQARGILQVTTFKVGYQTDSRIVHIVAATATQDFWLKPAIGAPPTEPTGQGQELPDSLRYVPSTTKGGRLLVFDGKAFATNSGVSRVLPTLVLTHGWIRCLTTTEDRTKNGVNDWPLDFARRMNLVGLTTNAANLVAWDWYDVARPCTLDHYWAPPPEGATPEQGLALGQALYDVLGSDYRQRIQFLGHSLGALVNSYAVDFVHGTNRGWHAAAAPPWVADQTQVTLFDEASIASILAILAIPEILEKDAVAEAFPALRRASRADYMAEASPWKNPIPKDFAFLDNYISCVGGYHKEGVNILLERPIWGAALDLSVSLGGLRSTIFDAHSVPMSWYGQTISASLPGSVGWNASVGQRVASRTLGVPQFDQGDLGRGGLWHQRLSGDDHWLEPGIPAEALLPPFASGLILRVDRAVMEGFDTAFDFISGMGNQVLSGVEGSIDWLSGQITDGVDWTAGKARSKGKAFVEVIDDLGDAAEMGLGWAADRVQQGESAILDLTNRGRIQIPLSTGPPPAGAQLQGAGAARNTPAYLWLPVVVPAEAEWMSFRFRIDGDGRDDALVMGIDGTSRFTLGTQFIGRDIVERSGLISVSDVAGRKAELFFGVVGGTSTNCTVTITAVEFRSFATPALRIQQDGGALMLTWPSSAPDWELQTAAALVEDEWQTVGVQPSLLGGRYRVSVPSAQAVQFFRLSQAR